MFGNRIALGTGFVNAVPATHITLVQGQATQNETKGGEAQTQSEAQEKHVEGDVTDKGQRQYEHIKASAGKKHGTKKAKQIAAATVNKGKFGPNRAKKGKGHAKGR